MGQRWTAYEAHLRSVDTIVLFGGADDSGVRGFGHNNNADHKSNPKAQVGKASELWI
jgi:hypothetical protein